jgi:hypothetical protein
VRLSLQIIYDNLSHVMQALICMFAAILSRYKIRQYKPSRTPQKDSVLMNKYRRPTADNKTGGSSELSCTASTMSEHQHRLTATEERRHIGRLDGTLYVPRSSFNVALAPAAADQRVILQGRRQNDESSLQWTNKQISRIKSLIEIDHVAIPSLTYSYQNLHQFHKNGAEC